MPAGAAIVAALPQTTDEVLAFHLHLDVVALIIGLAVAYELLVRRLAADYAPQGEPAVTRKHRVLFSAGLLSLFIVSSWPIHDLGEGSLFMLHMVEHIVYALVAPPLLLWGTPWWVMRVVVRPIMPLMRLLTRPFVALFLFNAVLGLVHVPGIVEAMITSDVFHLVMHAALLVTGILMFWPVIGPVPDLPKLEPFPAMGYLFLQSLIPTIPASFLTLGSKPLYTIYESLPRVAGISAYNDQVLAGLIMKFGGGLLLWAFIAGVFFTWYAEEERFTTRRVVRSS